MSRPEAEEGPAALYDAHGWLYHHIGRLSGGVLFLFAFAALAFLAVIGSTQALGLLLVIVAGFVIIVVGGHMRGGRR